MAENSYTKALIAFLVLGGIANLLLMLCLAHTWKYWRQVKWYIVMLLVGNSLEVAFTFGTGLGMTLNGSFEGSVHSCRFLMLMLTLGPNLSSMAVAALALHVLLTLITGCQGEKLRHGLVLGLFVLLSLPVPLAQIPLVEKRTISMFDGKEMGICHMSAGTREEAMGMDIGRSVAMVFFPVFVFLACTVASAVLCRSARTGNTKGDEDASDLVLSSLQGSVLTVLSVPFFVFHLVAMYSQSSHSKSTYETMEALYYLQSCRSTVSALVTVTFAYVHAFRNRGTGYISTGGQGATNGERQKLVN